MDIRSFVSKAKSRASLALGSAVAFVGAFLPVAASAQTLTGYTIPAGTDTALAAAGSDIVTTQVDFWTQPIMIAIYGIVVSFLLLLAGLRWLRRRLHFR